MAKTPVGAASSSAPAPITRDQVDRYVAVTSQIRSLERERDNLRPIILAALEYGYLCPQDGPFLIEVSYQERCVSSWKDITEAVLSILGERLRRQAADLIARMQSDKSSVAQVNVRPNPGWSTK